LETIDGRARKVSDLNRTGNEERKEMDERDNESE
jgi:hypothetical protein